MAQLLGANKQVLIFDLKIAKSFASRSIGLIGTRELTEHSALWILKCNSIHTFFMSFAIDCVFLNLKLEVVALKKNVKPWRMVFPIWKAATVIEMKSGLIEKAKIQLGDQLHVVN